MRYRGRRAATGRLGSCRTAASGTSERWDPANQVPSFETVWAYYTEIDDQWREDHIVEDWYEHIFYDDSRYYLSEKEEVGELVDELARSTGRDEDDEAVRTEALLIWIEDRARAEYEENYWDAVYEVEHHDGHDCWRVMHLPEGTDPTAVDPLGIYWSYEEDIIGGGQADFRRDPDQVRYRARIDDKNIDKVHTVLLNTEPGRVEWEAEVRFLPGSRIFVYDVEQSDGTVLPINAWRTA